MTDLISRAEVERGLDELYDFYLGLAKKQTGGGGHYYSAAAVVAAIADIRAIPAQGGEQRPFGLSDRPELSALLAEAVESVKCMSPDELEAMHKAQRESWVRGEMGIAADERAAGQATRTKEEEDQK